MDARASDTATDRLRPGGVAILVICIIFLIPAALAVILRLWARRIKRVHLVLNDYLIIAALFFAITETVTLLLAVTKGKVGYHMTELTTSEIVSLAKSYLAAEPSWVSANTCVKLSILHLYKQIFPIRKFRIVVYAVMLLVVAYWTSTIVRMFFLCSPLAFYWDKSIQGGTCLNTSATSLSVSVINLILDLIVIALPMPMLWGLQMATSRKMGLTAIFGIGGGICIITILRIVSVVNLDLNDLSYSGIDDAIWSELEPCLGIINACLPVLPPVMSHIFHPAVCRWKTWTGSSNTAQGTRTGPSFARQGLRANDSEAKNFRRLEEDVYPLTSVSFGGGQNHADAVAHGRSDLASGYPDARSGRATHGSDDIMVMKGWQVQSSSADKVEHSV